MIGDDHKAFAQAVMALAREHKMDSVMMQFRRSFNNRNREGPYSGDIVHANWSEGRHGAGQNIAMRSECHDSITELGKYEDEERG